MRKTYDLELQQRYLYIPLEIYRRELNGMLLLSVIAAHRGWIVIIGGKQKIFPLLNKFPEGIVLLKSVVPGEADLQKNFLDFGHRVVSVDAEGLLPSNGESGVRLRYSEESIELADMLFFWGQKQYEQVRDVFLSVRGSSEVTGSPIFDYWRYKKVTYIDKKINSDNKIILIATSFPYPNHFIDADMSYKAVKSASGNDATKEYLDEIFLDGELQELVFPLFYDFVESAIVQNPDCTVVLRPHPAENPELWQQLSECYDNVVFNVDGEITNLLLACDVFVHFNSTTSIEAYFYDKSIITFVPENLPQRLFDRLNIYALAASHVCRTVEESIESIGAALVDGVKSGNLNLTDIIEGADSSKIHQSSENIIDNLELLPLGAERRRFPTLASLYFLPNILKTRLKIRISWMVAWLDYWFKLFGGRYKHVRHTYRYGKSKQGDIDMVQIENMARKMARHLDLNHNSLCIRSLKQGLFLVKFQ